MVMEGSWKAAVAISLLSLVPTYLDFMLRRKPAKAPLGLLVGAVPIGPAATEY